MNIDINPLYPGVYRVTIGSAERLVPSFFADTPLTDKLNHLEDVSCRMVTNDIKAKKSRTGITVTLPLGTQEHIYGFGLQLKSFEQTGKKRLVRCCADPRSDTGESHASIPFYASTAGYAVMVDTARYSAFYCGNSRAKRDEQVMGHGMAQTTEELYDKTTGGDMIIDISEVQGVDIFIFEGKDMKDAICRYNLFSGGGVLPPMWGLGFLYRCYGGMNSDDVARLAETIRNDEIPCDVLGLEPGWQSHAYASSFEWDRERFPDYKAMTVSLKERGFRLNLWEQGFVAPEARYYKELLPVSGDYLVWGGLVPDLADMTGRRLYARRQAELIHEGADAFKVDECDGSDNTGGWSFPECSEFPSKLDGEQMHELFGILLQHTVRDCFNDAGKRTYGEVRASHLLAAPLPFVLYSDLYDIKDYMRGLTTAGFSGLLWTPEVRQTDNEEEYIRRLQLSALSPLATINAWMIPIPPWRQYDIDKNLSGIELEETQKNRLTDMTRQIIDFRMSLIPYLYKAFADYRDKGLPPFRALVIDYPDDANVHSIEDEILVGEDILAVPITDISKTNRQFYLPEGTWYRLANGERFESGWHTCDFPLEELPVFVKSGSLIPFAKPKQYVDEQPFEITAVKYGAGDAETVLIEDDGSIDLKQHNIVRIKSINGCCSLERTGNYNGIHFMLYSYKEIGS